MFSKEEITEYNNTSVSFELHQINCSKYDTMISRDMMLDTYTHKKLNISIKYGDIRNHQDQTIVNAANELLEGGGGVDGIIHQMCGNNMLEEIKKIPIRYDGSRIHEGGAIITNAHCDNFEYVIHTVAPYYDSNNCMKHNIMEKCFDSIFKQILSKDIKSITIIPIGTGFYGFHMYDFTIICFRKIIQWLDEKDIKITLLTNSKLQYNYYQYFYDTYLFNL